MVARTAVEAQEQVLTNGDVCWRTSRWVRSVVGNRVSALVRVDVTEEQQINAILVPQRLIPAGHHTLLSAATYGTTGASLATLLMQRSTAQVSCG